MENVFVLIGFSGDDPNFLHWSGWVRDHLGVAAPPIYLCGLLDLSPSQRQLLESRNIKSVDLSRVFPKAEWPDREERHQAATAWFLEALRKGAPPNRRQWPSSLNPDKTSGVLGGSAVAGWPSGLPAIPPGPAPLSGPGPMHPSSDTGEISIEALRLSWKKTRTEYPGWVVPPRTSREMLWRFTKDWIDPILGRAEQMSAAEKVLVFYEFNWRLEATLTPLLTPWGDEFVRALLDVNPFPKLMQFEAQITPSSYQSRDIDWRAMRDAWMELAFAVLRLAREDLDQERFNEWSERLSLVAQTSPAWWARWCHEQALYALTKRNLAAVRTHLTAWPVRRDLPLWELRRAAIIAELGDLGDAREVVEEALLEIRSRHQPGSVDYALLSQEGWAMLLHRMLRRGDWSEPAREHLSRWEQLSSYGCDPRQEMEQLELLLRESPTTRKNGHRTTRGFDPGRVTYHWSIGSGDDYFDARSAFALIRLAEVAGLPLVCGHTTLAGELEQAAARMEPYAPLWAISVMIRGHVAADGVEERFDRVRIATLPPEGIALLHSYLQEVVQHLLKEGQSAGSAEEMGLACELLSRLAFRLSESDLSHLLDLALTFTRDSRFHHYPLLRTVTPLFLRILYCIPKEVLAPFVPRLLEIPIPEADGFTVDNPRAWPEPMVFLSDSIGPLAVNSLERSVGIRVGDLINVVSHGTPEARERAVIRLSRLFDMDLLTEEQQKLFSLALWSRTDDRGLPINTGMFPWVLLTLPEPHDGHVADALRSYLRHGSPGDPDISGPFSSDDEYIQTWLHTCDVLEPSARLSVQPDDVLGLLPKVSRQWDQLEIELAKPIPDVFGRIRGLMRQARLLRELLIRVIYPRLDKVDLHSFEWVETLIKRMSGAGVETVSAAPLRLMRAPDLVNEVAQQVSQNLYHARGRTSKGAAVAVFRWVQLATRNLVPPPPEFLVQGLVNVVAVRHMPTLEMALGLLTRVVQDHPQFITEAHTGLLCTGLELLLNETELQTDSQIAEQEEDAGLGDIPLVDRPRVRAAAAKLAKSMMLSGHFVEHDAVLQRWRHDTRNDVLPEVRRVWFEVESQ